MFTEIGNDGIEFRKLPCAVFLRTKCHVLTRIFCPDNNLVDLVNLPEDSGLSPYHIELASDWLETLGLSERRNELSQEDLITCLQALGHCPNLEYLETMLEELNIINREIYTFGDLCFLWNRFIQSHDEEVRLLEKAFQFFDKDQNGSLSIDEFRTANRELGNLLTDSEIKKFVEIVDVTNDGDIQYEELLASLMSQYDIVSQQISGRSKKRVVGAIDERAAERLLREHSSFEVQNTRPNPVDTVPTHQTSMRRSPGAAAATTQSELAVGIPSTDLHEMTVHTQIDSPILRPRSSSNDEQSMDNSTRQSSRGYINS